MSNIQDLRQRFMLGRIPPLDWLGDSPSRFDMYTKFSEGCESILELGVYSGLTTTAFLLSIPKKIISIDITDQYFSNKNLLKDIAKNMGVDYTFLLMNDLEFESAGQDLLFIDTTHTFEQTLAELNKFGQLTRKRIILHDVSSHMGVYRAVFQWLWNNKNFYIKYHDSRGDGLIVLDRMVGV